jgi:uncharacterized protein (TIGR00369 family)
MDYLPDALQTRNAAIAGLALSALTAVAVSKVLKIVNSPVRDIWQSLGGSWLGRALFARLISFYSPYTGTVSPSVPEMGDNHAVAVMKECRSVRNPFRSVHAAALVNLAEFASGCAVLYSLPKKTRAIVTDIHATYIAKARGTLTATAKPDVDLTKVNSSGPVKVVVTVQNSDKQTVCIVTVSWTVSVKN